MPAVSARIQSAILIDADGVMGRAYGAKATPHMFLIDSDAGQTLRYSGAIDTIRSSDPADIEEATNYIIRALDQMSRRESVQPDITTPLWVRSLNTDREELWRQGRCRCLGVRRTKFRCFPFQDQRRGKAHRDGIFQHFVLEGVLGGDTLIVRRALFPERLAVWSFLQPCRENAAQIFGDREFFCSGF